jgi:hypothetical protein
MGRAAHARQPGTIDTPSVENDVSSILDRIEAVLRDRPSGGAEAVARIETTLTDGYAGALALEGAQLRLERRIGEVAGGLTSDNAVESAYELSRLGEELAVVRDDLLRLRGRLADLRRCADAVRAA